MINTLISIIVNAISMGTIFLFACVGETLTEKAGNLNLGIPGVMCIGATGGGLAVSLFAGHTSSLMLVLLSILFTLIAGALAGLLYGFITITMHGNQNVTGLALTTFGVGFMKFFSKRMYDQTRFVKASASFKRLFGERIAGSDNFFCRIFLSHGVLVYLAVLIAIVASYFLNKTKTGLHLRAVGEMPATADAAGINVSKYKYLFVVIGSSISGLGGLYYVMDRGSGTIFAEAAIDSFGWLAVALVIATMWKPVVAIFGSILFGGLFILDAVLDIPSMIFLKVFPILPYLITVIVLVITSVMDKKENQPPASLGINYYREER